jgi:surfactin synthase thioesterase subunit
MATGGKASANGWLLCRTPRVRPLLRLVAIPPSGAGAGFYHGWGAELPHWVETWAVAAPGREHRLSEPVPRHLADHVEAIAEALRPLDDAPVVLFGHSMGSLVGFELARRLCADASPPPQSLYVSALRPPSLRPDHEPEHLLPAEALIATVRRRYGGLPSEVEAYPEVLEWALGVLRGDLRAMEEYCYQPTMALPIPITAFGGDADPAVPLEDLHEWVRETQREFAVQAFPGNHRYLEAQRSAVLTYLANDLRTRAASASP